MPPTTRNRMRAMASPELGASEIGLEESKERQEAQEPQTFEEVFSYQSSASEKESDSDFTAKKKIVEKGKKRVKTAKGRIRNPTTEPKAVPPMSDEIEEPQEVRCSSLNDFPFSQVTAQHPPVMKLKQDAAKRGGYRNEAGGDLPKVLRIEVGGIDNRGPITLNINLAELIFEGQKLRSSIKPEHSDSEVEGYSDDDDEDDNTEDNEAGNKETLVYDTIIRVETKESLPFHRSKHQKTLDNARLNKLMVKGRSLGFKDLPLEIRERVYRFLFVEEEPIRFTTRGGLERSSQFLRTCSMVHVEGRGMLYGENAFHFERSSATRGRYFEKVWKEVGFKDIRRFLEAVGEINLSMIKYVSFNFSDAAPSATPTLDDEERRCVNDPVLHHIFEMIGGSTVLFKLALTFGLRRALSTIDHYFFKSLTLMKCHKLIHVPYQTYSSLTRVPPELLNKMELVMEVGRKVDDDIDASKRKEPKVKMYHEKSSARVYYGTCGSA